MNLVQLFIFGVVCCKHSAIACYKPLLFYLYLFFRKINIESPYLKPSQVSISISASHKHFSQPVVLLAGMKDYAGSVLKPLYKTSILADDKNEIDEYWKTLE